jgi:hypothetical protein
MFVAGAPTGSSAVNLLDSVSSIPLQLDSSSSMDGLSMLTGDAPASLLGSDSNGLEQSPGAYFTSNLPFT